MTKKSKDVKNRWRNVTVSFRVSPQENELLNSKVYLCGCTKQDYIINRLLENNVNVIINKKISTRIIERLDVLTETIKNINCGSDVVVDEIKFILNMLSEIKYGE